MLGTPSMLLPRRLTRLRLACVGFPRDMFRVFGLTAGPGFPTLTHASCITLGMVHSSNLCFSTAGPTQDMQQGGSPALLAQKFCHEEKGHIRELSEPVRKALQMLD